MEKWQETLTAFKLRNVFKFCSSDLNFIVMIDVGPCIDQQETNIKQKKSVYMIQNDAELFFLLTIVLPVI